MITAFRSTGDRLVRMDLTREHLRDALWIDLDSPTPAEEDAVELAQLEFLLFEVVALDCLEPLDVLCECLLAVAQADEVGELGAEARAVEPLVAVLSFRVLKQGGKRLDAGEFGAQPGALLLEELLLLGDALAADARDLVVVGAALGKWPPVGEAVRQDRRLVVAQVARVLNADKAPEQVVD